MIEDGVEAGAWPSDCRNVTNRREKASQPHLRTKNLADQATHHEQRGKVIAQLQRGFVDLEV